jgi:cytochrome P450
LTEAVVVMARLLARYRIELAAGSEHVQPRAIVTTQPDRPVRFILRARG